MKGIVTGIKKFGNYYKMRGNKVWVLSLLVFTSAFPDDFIIRYLFMFRLLKYFSLV